MIGPGEAAENRGRDACADTGACGELLDRHRECRLSGGVPSSACGATLPRLDPQKINRTGNKLTLADGVRFIGWLEKALMPAGLIPTDV